MEVDNITKADTFNSRLHLSYKNTITFFVTVLSKGTVMQII